MKPPPAPPKPTATTVIGGQQLHGPHVEIVNPADPLQVVGTHCLGNPDDAHAAVMCAHAAFPAWSTHPPAARAERLVFGAQAIDSDSLALATLLTQEHGKVLGEATAEIANATATLRYYAGLAAAWSVEKVNVDHRGKIIERRVPMGVAAVIVPWNFPVLLAMLMLAPVLVAGNTAVVKLPDYAPLALSSALHRLAGSLPVGVLNVLSGTGPDVGMALTRHPLVRKISFTGSTETGRTIMRDASVTLKNLSLELGGNDPAVLLADAHLDEDLIDQLATGCFTASGQVCYAPKRLYVHQRLFSDFVEAFTAHAAKLVLGNGLHRAVTMGPVCNQRQFQRLSQLIESSRDDGADVVQVGQIHESASSRGYFVRPTIVTGLSEDAALVTQEQFGPVVPILSFADDEQAVARANATEFGLAASVWSADIDHALAVGRRIQAGSVFINVHRVGASDVTMPFGGFKQSGIGRGHGVQALEEASELQILAQRNDMRYRPQASRHREPGLSSEGLT
ncbi:aldehyde dehydrogenase family protein [Mycobacterium sp. 3519A]|uniref:aldehyde dehydrogenase family protein n=1 Tax=Mycobacterium sp. 3519A TaxID=2057184 RepID=UPI000C7B8C88|nr:aldehyde dehydrogenase family protein [Mycobacterium sp. 3519A]